MARQIAERRSLKLWPVLVSIDEFQRYSGHPMHGEEIAADAVPGSSGGTDPLDCPKSASVPRTRSDPRLFSNVVCPTES